MNTQSPPNLPLMTTAPCAAPRPPAPGRSRSVIAIALTACLLSEPLLAAQTEISNSPLASTTSATVKPNIMFILDNSGSMASLDMPDSMGSYENRIGYKNHLCNTIYYNPATTYVAPKKADGSNFTNASFTAAYPNGYTNYPTGPTSGAVNLSTSFTAYSGNTSQPAYYYVYTGTQTLEPSTGACIDSDPNSTSTYNSNITATGGGTWQKRQVTSTSGPGSTDERQNFANWYQYYRSRMHLMKATASRSFNQLTDSYRVGFVTIEPGNPVNSSQYVAISDFNSTQRDSWFSTLFGISPFSITPLREALSRVGRHYAGKTTGINAGMTGDPIQYSCQQNFAILTTDGYWNGNAGDDLNGNTIGNHDGDINITPRPLWDGTATFTTVTNKSNTYNANVDCSSAIQRRNYQDQRRDQQHQTRTQQIQERRQQIQERRQQVQQRTQQRQRQTEQLQRQIDQLQANTEQLTFRTEQQQATRTTTTFARSNLVITASTSNALSASTINGISIGGTARLFSPVTSNVSSSRQARSLALATGIVLTGGFSVIAVANCAGTNNPISGCSSNGAYITMMATSGSPVITSSVSTSGLTNVTTTTNSFSGGSITSNVTSNVSTCSVGTVVSPSHVSTQTTACPVSDTGFVNLSASVCSGTGGAFNASGTRITCGSTTSGLQNLAATSCTTAVSYNASGRRIIACNTVTGTFADLAATSCTPTAPSFNSSGQRISCQTIISSPFANFASSTCTTTAPAFNSSGQRFTCQITDTGFANASSCTATSPAGGFTGAGTQVTCQTTDTGFVSASSCTPNGGPVAGLTVTCNTTDTGFTSATSCTPNSGPVAGLTVTCNTTDSNFNNSGSCTPSVVGGLTTTCQITSDTGWVNGSCTASNPSSGPTRTCRTTDSGWFNVSSCSTDTSGSTRNGCRTGQSGKKITYTTTTSSTTTNVATGAVTSSGPTTGSAQNWDGICYAGGNGLQTEVTPGVAPVVTAMPTPPADGIPLATEQPTPPAGCASWPCTTTTSSGGHTGTLADVAAYYYLTDLRPSMADNVPASGTGVENDTATWQHMTTFTLGLGLAGVLTYDANYKNSTSGDFQGLRDGTILWPNPIGSSTARLDDLWHAAVNGRGQFFSASNPDSVVSGLSSALSGINARIASAAAAATSNLEPVAGDNFAYTAKYKTVDWTGELEAHEIDLTTGEVKTAVIWSAQAAVDATTGPLCDNRNIWLYRSGETNNRTKFTWNTKACDTSATPYVPTGSADTSLNAAEQAFFSATEVAALSQYPSMTDGTGSPATDNQRGAAVGDKLVNFIRGQRGYEGFVPNNANKLYRTRVNILGDIVNAQPVYVKSPFASYSDSGYLDGGSPFKTTGTASTRAAMVYVASNDGMLHAFYAGSSTSDPLGGKERWTWIPTMVLPNLYKLADNNYANNHRYSVDGTPTVGDFYDSNASTWKTMLVAGINAGGKGYYAIDITDPATPKGLWEFKWSDTCYSAGDASTHYADCHIGYTFSNPIVSKLADGTWVVFVTSGYNNINSPAKAGDGEGYLYVLRAYDGKILHKISTGVGDSTTPSGLNHIVNWVDNTLVNNTTLRLYGGDLLGNMWRFDVNDTILPAGREATLVGQAKSPGASGLPQPITTRPELALNGSDPFVLFATGRMLGATDLTDTQVQSIWGVIDPMTATTGYSNLRSSMKPLAMTQTTQLLDQNNNACATASATCVLRTIRTVACSGSTTECAITAGWVVDLPDSKERVNVDPKLQLGTLVVASNVPSSDACSIGGYSWLNFLNYSTGTAVANATAGMASQKLSDSLAVGLNIVRLPDGKTVVITTTSDAKQTTVSAPFDTPSPTGKRISWREISQ
jgi:Tfp pilus tip-associated adhesin PilY1